MKTVRMTMMASAIATLMSVGLSAHAANSVPAKSAENANTKYFVELNSLPTIEGGRLESLRSEKEAFRKALAKSGLKLKERRSFDSLFNGLSVEIAAKDRAKLERIPGVKQVFPMIAVAAPKPVTAEVVNKAIQQVKQNASVTALPPTNASALAMTGADRAQSELGLTGAGIKVGIIDSGIDIDHPDLGGNGVPGGTAFPSARVAYGYDFVGDAYNADPASAAYNPIPAPDANPDDCGGHGSHVAGIVGGNGAIKGVAPGVTFGAYRVFGCAGSTDSDIILAAMERAKADGMQVVNQSLGAAFQWPQYPTARAADSLAKSGIVMVASIGNSGASGLFTAGAPGVGKNVIGVASYDNTTVDLREFNVSGIGAAIGYFEGTPGPSNPTTGTFPLARTGTTAATADACAPLAAGSLTGQVALVRRGTCSFWQKAFYAQSAGAVGVILYNNTTGYIVPSLTGTPAITIPVSSVLATDGAAIDAQIQAGSATITYTAGEGNYPNPTGAQISSFSSFGLAPDLSFKPNLGAPGGSILSSYPLEQGGYAFLSGTSMSSPNVAGTAALMLQANPKLKPAEIKIRLQETADPKTWGTSGLLDNTYRQGAGMIDVVQAITTKAIVKPSEIALGDTASGPVTKTITLQNKSTAPVTYTLSNVGALATGPNTFVPAYYNAPATAAFSAPTVTVPAKGTASFDVTITAPAGFFANSMYGGYVVMTAENETLRVPYAGIMGDYQSIPVMTPTANGFPWLAQLSGGSYFNRNAAGATYTMAGDDIPFFLIHLDHFARKMLFTAFDSNGVRVGTVSKDNFLPRSSTSTGFYSWAWDGSVQKGGKTVTVPNGTYTVKIDLLKALGDESNPADLETWTSSVITIARP